MMPFQGWFDAGRGDFQDNKGAGIRNDNHRRKQGRSTEVRDQGVEPLRSPDHGRIKDIVNHVVKILEQDKAEGIAQLVPEVSAGGKLTTAPLV